MSYNDRRGQGSYLYDFREYAVPLLTSADPPFLFIIALPAMLKFQFALFGNLMVPKTRIADNWGCQIAPFCLNLRQLIGSSGGKELVQVTLA